MLLVTIRCALLKLLSISCRVNVIDCSNCSSSSVSVRLRCDVWRDMSAVVYLLCALVNNVLCYPMLHRRDSEETRRASGLTFG